MNQMKGMIFSLAIILTQINSVFSQICTYLEPGDFLFQSGKGSNFENAVIHSTSEVCDWHFSHCGVVYFEKDSIFVLEATPEKGVVKTRYEDFYKDSNYLVVGRLKQDYQYVIPHSLSKILALIGKKYDFVFSPDNDAYYCSELIQQSFTDSVNCPLFEPVRMTFKDRDTGETLPFWIAYFKGLNAAIPEGEWGSNPTDLSHSDKLVLNP
jgi:hypothetical protein